MAGLAKRLPILFFLATATGISEGGCNCAELKEKIAQLEAEVKALRAVPQEVAGDMVQHTTVPETPSVCNKSLNLSSDHAVTLLRGCRSAKELFISGAVTDLTPLGSLEEVEFLGIREAPDLTSLTGLESLRVASLGLLIFDTAVHSISALQSLVKVRHIVISANPWLVSTTGLEHVTDVASVAVTVNSRLERLTGLWGVTHLEELHIYQNNLLWHVSAFRNLDRVTNELIIQDSAISSLAFLGSLRAAGSLRISHNYWLGWGIGHLDGGLERLEHVQDELRLSNTIHMESLNLGRLKSVGALSLIDLPHLTSLAGLGRLAYAGGWVTIMYCGVRSLAGLALQHVGSLSVWNRWIQPRMDYLGGPLAIGASVDAVNINDEAWPSCVTPHERMALVSGVHDPNNSYVPQNVVHVPIGNPTSVPDEVWSWCKPRVFGTFSCTKGQRCSFALTGEETISISGRFSGCGVCSESELRINVPQSGVVDLGYDLKYAEAGLRSVCSCSSAGGPVAQLQLRGPRNSGLAVCIRGHDCKISVDGDGLERSDHMVLMSNCNEGDPLLVANWAAETMYLLHGPAFHAAPPTRYQLCWKAPCTSAADGTSCPAEERTYIHVSDVNLFGVFPQDHALVLGADDLSTPNVGFGVLDGDRMRLRRVCGQRDVGESDDMEANSSGKFFRFGKLTEERVQPGTHHLCWCQEHDGMACNAERHFMAEAGTVQVLCPRGQQPGYLGGCEKCPAGTQQPEAGLKPCSECPTGKFSQPGEECEACQEGDFAALPGSAVCTPCARWQIVDADAAGCSSHPPNLFLLGFFLLSVGAFCALLVYITRRRLSIVDVSLDQGQTIITTLGSHGLANFWRASFPVTLHKTGHPGLDSASEPMRAKVKDAVRLELLTQKGEHIDRRLDTSMGTLVVPFPLDLYHQRWPLPTVLLLPVLLIAVLALCFLVLQVGMITEALLGAATVPPVLAAFSAALRWRRRATPLAQRLLEFSQVLAEKLPNPESCPKGPNRALAVGKLHEVLGFFRDFIRDRTAYYIDSNLLTPLTKSKRLSYAELVGCGDAEWFVSHFWGTAFEHFCTALQKHALGVCGDRPWMELRYWVCFCSNNQHHLADELGGGWEASSFYITLNSGRCQGTCMVLDDNAMPLTRVWCIFELLQTLKLQRSRENFQGLLLCTSSGVLNTGGGSIEVAMALASRVAQMDLQKAEASNEKDRRMIQDQVFAELGSFDVLNDFVTHEVREMLVQAQRHSNEQFTSVLTLLEPHFATV